MSEADKRILNLWFNNIKGIGNAYRKRLLESFGSVERVFDASADAIFKVLKRNDLVENIHLSRQLHSTYELLKKLSDRNIWFTFPDDESYPQKLKNIYDPPDILYVKGRLNSGLNLYNSCIGIIGSRNADIYGREMARMFARELSARGISVISGLARGIDSMAHIGALDADGYTLAVLGCGINVTYPAENAELFSRIECKGAIISEYGLDVSPSAGTFPVRNRIISGMSDGILVVEAKKKSGSLITADLALEQGRTVYALPGRAMDINCEGTNNLIKQGAICVTQPDDILNDLKGEDDVVMDNCKELNVSDIELQSENVKKFLAPAEKMVYSCLGLEPVYIDDIIRISGMGITKVISTLYIMEEKKIIKQPVRGYYIIAV